MENKVILSDIVAAIATRKKMPLGEADNFVKAFFGIISDALIDDGVVKIKGLGTFKLVEMQERESVDVTTGERIVIPGHLKVAFTPDTLLKDQVNRPFSIFQTVVLNDGTPLEEMEKLDQVPETMPSTTLSEDEQDDIENSLPDETDDSEFADIPTSSDETEATTFVQDDISSDETESLATTKDDPLSDETDNSEQIESEELTSTDDMSEPEVPHLEQENLVKTSITAEASLPEENPVHQPAQPVSALSDSTSDVHSPRLPLWRHLLTIILVLLLMAGSYMAGYYRIPDMKQLRAAFMPKLEIETQVEEQEAEPAPEKESEESEEEKVIREAVDRYPQVPGGKYLIIGTKGVRQMKRGDTLLKMARQEYGHPDFAKYIIVFNQFPDPDVIPLGSDVKLPELVEHQLP